ncbi:MAG: hypothetical protein KKI02_01555 [Planctomycetes bacterium]|nr:hypothetical protein [Planctomycetota bacterium]
MRREACFSPILLGLAGVVAVTVLWAVGCNSQLTGTLANLPGQSGGSSVLLSLNDDPDSSTVATITDSASSMALIVTGEKDADGTASKLTSISGTMIDGANFEATFAEGTPAGLIIGDLRMDISQVDDTTFEATEVDADSAKIVASLRYTISIDHYDALTTLYYGPSLCEQIQCSVETRRTLSLITHFAVIQAIGDSLFNERCLDTDEYDADECLALLAFVGTLGDAIDGMIAGTPDLPAEVRAMCFGLSEDCDMLVYAPLSPDFTDSDEDDETPPDVQVQISGPTELQANAEGTYTASATGATVEFTWDLLGTAGSLVSTTATGATVRAGSVSGTLSLVAEARDPTTDSILETASYTISVVSAPQTVEYVVWYDREDTCWDAPVISVSTRSTFEAETGDVVEMQGGFLSVEEGRTWVCAQVESRFDHAWCSTHYNIDGSYYLIPYYWGCDFSDVPWDN